MSSTLRRSISSASITVTVGVTSPTACGSFVAVTVIRSNDCVSVGSGAGSGAADSEAGSARLTASDNAVGRNTTAQPPDGVFRGRRLAGDRWSARIAEAGNGFRRDGA
jgi:hypothetical protein